MKTILIAALVVAFTNSVAKAGQLMIVENGQPRATIVVVTNEVKAVNAANEIQKYIEKMSGAKLPIVNEGEKTDAPVTILVGHTAAAAKLGIKIPAGFDPSIRPEAFEEEGYVLKTAGNQLIVGGNSDGPYQGTVYAAYALLEKLGCRWYFPGEWGEIVPQQKTLTVSDLNVVKRPDFAIRRIWLSGWVPMTPQERKVYDAWCPKIGFDSNQMYPTVGDGFLGFLLPPGEFYDKHPEYYAMDKAGSRKPWTNPRTGKFGDRNTMLCLSNPEVLTQSVTNLREAFAGKRKMANVTASGFGISPPDGAPFCYCDKCIAGNQNFNYPTYVQERMQSEEFFTFASNLAKEFPDKWCATFAYSLREVPPQGVKLPPNVTVHLAPISCCVLHPNNDPTCWRRQEYVEELKQWRRQTPHVYIYDYNPGFLTGNWVPERDTANMTINAPIYKQIGIKGLAREGRKAFMQTWLSYYVMGRLMWDSKADVAAIKKDFYDTFFGPDAGPHVQAWWDACEDALVKGTCHVHEDWLVNHIYTVDFAKKIHAHVEAARAAKMTDEQKGRVEAFALIADHLEAFAAMNAAEENLDYAQAAKEAGRMDEDETKLNAIYSFFLTPDHSANPRIYFAQGRKRVFEALEQEMHGTNGTLVAQLSLEMKFSRDPFNHGVLAEWYAPSFADKNWGTKNTFLTWDQQDPPEDSMGHDYDGYGWYRGTFDVASSFKDKPVRLFLGGISNEAWIWINGEYAGHRPFNLWWMQPSSFDLDVSKQIKPGQNTVTIRIWNNADIGGLFRRGFFWSPKEMTVK